MSTCIEIGIEALTSNGEEKELQNLMVLNPFCLACPDRAASHYDILLAYIKSPAGQRTDSGRDKATRMTYLVLPMIISIIPFTIEPDPARFTTTLETLYNVIHSTGVTVIIIFYILLHHIPDPYRLSVSQYNVLLSLLKSLEKAMICSLTCSKSMWV
jgi:hypothetical protein